MGTAQPLGGVYAAIITPRDGSRRPDAAALQHIVRFLQDCGIRGFVLNGATGEYCLNSPTDLACMLEAVSAALDPGGRLICGIGAGDFRGVLENGRAALSGGACAVLLPMPYFYPYEQHDLRAFCLEAAACLPLDILLYNLPQFTSPLHAETVAALIRSSPRIKGIKDSSGSLDLLRMLTSEIPGAIRLVGSDGALAQALREGVCDGVVSGVAGVVPELILSVFQNEGWRDAATVGALHELISHIDALPVPWGLKCIAEIRGLATARYSLPLSEARARAGEALRSWFHQSPMVKNSPKIDP